VIEDMRTILAEHPFLQGLEPQIVDALVGCATHRPIAAGQFLFREGESADSTFLLKSGRIALEIHVPGRDAVRIQTVGAGEAVGWSWLFPPYRWHFDARALEDTRTVHLDGACLRQKCESDHSLGFGLAKRFLLLVHQRLERTRMQILDVYGAPV
jgi:CRP-like cAMP-binding protein